MRDVKIHEFCRRRLKRALGRRSLAWLAREADVPQSTLATQVAKPRFSLTMLCRVAEALDRDIAWFLPRPHPAAQDTEEDLGFVLDELEGVLRRAGRRVSPTPSSRSAPASTPTPSPDLPLPPRSWPPTNRA